MTSDFLKNYDMSAETIKKLYDSRLRLAIIDALEDGPLRLADLRRAVDANAPNTSTKAKELESMGIIERIDGDYALTAYGKAVKEKIQNILDFHVAYENLKEFWEERDVTPIPDFLWSRLGELKGCEISRAKEPEIMKTHEECIQIMQSPKKELLGISPVFRPIYMQIAMSLMELGIHTEFIITDKVIEKAVEHLTPETTKLIDNYKNQIFYLNNNVNFALKVTDSWFYLALRSKSVGEDMMGITIQSKDPEAIKWGKDLYEYYKKDAKPVKMKDYL